MVLKIIVENMFQTTLKMYWVLNLLTSQMVLKTCPENLMSSREDAMGVNDVDVLKTFFVNGLEDPSWES